MDEKSTERALQTIPYGLYVLGSIKGKTVATIVVNWVTQVSFRPALIAVAIEDDSKMRLYVERSHLFSINILPAGGTETAKSFMKPVEPIANKINGKEFFISKNGLPFLKDAVASLECRVVSSHQTGDHVIFVGEVTDSLANTEGDVLTLKETGWKYRGKGSTRKSPHT